MKNTPKYILGFLGTLIFRLITPSLGLSNISPLMATELAGSKAFGAWAGFWYGALSMIFIDLLMGKIGSWTIVTSLTYGAIGTLGSFLLKSRNPSAKNFIWVSVVGTLIFDLITGVLAGPILFGGSFLAAAIGQVPFTLRHLLGNIVFAGVLAPWFYKKIMINPKFKLDYIFKTLTVQSF